jgi:hypothetical protein
MRVQSPSRRRHLGVLHGAFAAGVINLEPHRADTLPDSLCCAKEAGGFVTGGPTFRVGGMYAMRAAYHSTALVDTDHRATLDAVTGYALRAHTQATGGVRATPIVKLTRHAIRSWRELAGLDNQNDAQLEIGRQRPATHRNAGTHRVTARTSFQMANRQSSIAP